ncbi:MAG: alpha/beta fold hydrolase, partial [Silanimonas sp.]
MNATTLNRASPLRRLNAISADGTRLAVQEWSPRRDDGRPTIVLVHAWSQSHLGWRPLFERDLLDTFHVVSFDLRGHGESDAP